jgi:hypothetical protein
MWNTSNGMFQTKYKAEIELNFIEYFDSKRYLAEPDIVKYDMNNKPQYDLILGVKTMKKYGIILDFKDKMITIDEVRLPMQNINYLQGSSTLCVLKINHSLAMELHSTQDANRHVTRILYAKYQKADLHSIVRGNRKHLSTNQQKKILQLLKKYESLFDGTLGDWKTKPASFQLRREYHPTMAELSQCQKSTKTSLWNTLNRRFQTKRKADSMNFFEYFDSKRYLEEPDIVECDRNNKPQYDLILGVKLVKKYGIILDFKDKMITVDEVRLPMQNIIYLQGSSTLRLLKLNHSLAMEPHSTQDTTKLVP